MREGEWVQGRKDEWTKGRKGEWKGDKVQGKQ
jgi:hypothetical protein